MKTSEQAQVMARLRYMDQQQARLIGEAIGKVPDGDVSAELEAIRADHERHTHEIDALFGECGEELRPVVPEAEQQLAQERFARLSAETDARSVLEIVLDAEQMCEAAYARADAARLPADEGPAMAAHYDEEKRHVDVLEARV